MARELWTLVLSLFGFNWAMPKRVVNLACWKGRSTIGMDAFGMQSLWKVRNFRTFEGIERPMMVMKLLFLHTEWIATLSGHSFSSLLDLVLFVMLLEHPKSYFINYTIPFYNTTSISKFYFFFPVYLNIIFYYCFTISFSLFSFSSLSLNL